MEQPRKEHLVMVAAGLFNQHGYHQCGVDEIIQQSGVSKTTLYKHFRTKEDLILEVLQRRSEVFFSEIARRLAQCSKVNPDIAPNEQIDEILKIVDEWIRSNSFFGCNFVRAAAEYGSSDNLIRAHARRHKARLSEVISNLLEHWSKPERELASDQIMIVLDGAITTAQVSGRNDTVKTARSIMDMILTSYSADSGK